MTRLLLASLLTFAGATSVGAQALPTEPISVGDGRVVVGAEVTVTYAGEDPGFFNYTDYEYSALRNLRVGIGAEVRANRWLQVLSELRVDRGINVEPFSIYARTHVEPFTAYVRVRPWPNRRFDLHVGRIPPTFGAFARTSYGTNTVIGVPLAYQYLTSLRTDALPATTNDLLGMRGRGWLSSFQLGSPEPDRGLPIINAVHSDVGFQAHGVHGIVEWIGAVTRGTLSNPRADHLGRQFVGRAIVRPIAPIALGVSAARGEFLHRSLARVLSPGLRMDDGVQRSVGVDAEYSEGRFLARTELIRTRWTLPIALTSDEPEALDATSFLAEARYRLVPGWQLAARAERLDFARLPVPGGMQRWEAPVTRVEIGTTYSVTRNIGVKVSWQRNTRDGGRIRRDSLGAMQVLYWF